jgi:hypothetical protein
MLMLRGWEGWLKKRSAFPDALLAMPLTIYCKFDAGMFYILGV